MSLKYLLDTNVLSEPIRPKPNQQILNKLEQHQDELATATLVWHELLFGCQRLPVSRKRKILEQYLYETVTQMPILYIQEAAEWHAQERARLSLNGKMLKAKLRLIIALFICLL
ncbi:PIN domain-containing protein [Candidatus Marithrix sp. Canyon 246]|uniref:PIN domain-containing protein n=1 Tax=Candidatus Marithrix sp. Canyon 246 TaxID=1827136 RepID=UPI000849F7EE|nr:PIN domain-containing protein [Candidatus Marithrix sp. Canyon 246]